MSICQDCDFIKMARRSTVTWRSRVLVRAKSPFVDDFRVGNNKRKRDIEDKKKPGKDENLEEQISGKRSREQIMEERKKRKEAFNKYKEGKSDPLGKDKYKSTKGDVMAIALAPLGAVALAAAFVGGGELAAGLEALDQLAEIAGTSEIELPNYKMD